MWRPQTQPKLPAPSEAAQWVSRCIKGLLLLFPIGFLGWFLSAYFVLSGTYVTETTFCSKSNDFSPLLPWDQIGKIETEEVCGQALFGPMITFDVKAPRWFEKVSIEMEFDPHDQPVMDFALRRRDLITLDKQPMLATVLDDPRWIVQEQDGLKFYQKQPRYPDPQAFLSDPAALKTEVIGTYHYTLATPDLLPAYRPQPDHRVRIDKTLRGAHRFSVYLKDEPLDLTIAKQDLNAYPGRDPLLIKISLFDQAVETVLIEDDGDDLGGGTTRGPVQSASILKENLPEGPYLIELVTNDDVLIRSIDSGHERLVFHDRVFLADNVEYFPDLDPASQATQLITDASSLLFSTSHDNGIQSVTAGQQSVEIKRLNHLYRVAELSERSAVLVPKNDVLIQGNGLFAFSADHWFSLLPDNIIPLSRDSSPTFEMLDVAIAQSVTPERFGQTLRSTHEFDLQPFLSNDYQVRGVLLLPQIDERKSQVDLLRIRATFTKPPITVHNIWERGMNVLRRSR